MARDRIDLAPGTSHTLAEAGSDVLLGYGTSGDQVLLVGIDLAAAAGIVFI